MGTATEPPDMADTSIRVSEELADELYRRKGRANSYEDFLWQLLSRLDELEGQEEHPPTPPEPAAEPVEAEKDDTHNYRDELKDELAGSEDLLERRVDAILLMYDVLRERGEAEKDELLDAVDVDATGYASADSVWSNMVKGCDTLRSLPGVELPPTGRTVWKFREENK